MFPTISQEQFAVFATALWNECGLPQHSSPLPSSGNSWEMSTDYKHPPHISKERVAGPSWGPRSLRLIIHGRRNGCFGRWATRSWLFFVWKWWDSWKKVGQLMFLFLKNVSVCILWNCTGYGPWTKFGQQPKVIWSTWRMAWEVRPPVQFATTGNSRAEQLKLLHRNNILAETKQGLVCKNLFVKTLPKTIIIPDQVFCAIQKRCNSRQLPMFGTL